MDEIFLCPICALLCLRQYGRVGKKSNQIKILNTIFSLFYYSFYDGYTWDNGDGYGTGRGGGKMQSAARGRGGPRGGFGQGASQTMGPGFG